MESTHILRPTLSLNSKNKNEINNIVVLGDSISDRGTIEKRELLGFIPMKLILMLTAHTHNGRFTNGYTWNDDLGVMLASGFIAEHFKNKHKHIIDDADLSDSIITKDKALMEEFYDTVSLKDDRVINYRNTHFIRTYCEGGMTSADYRNKFVASIPLTASRFMLSTLSRQREKMLADDKAYKIDADEKRKTLVIEWSGGNDLITVNKSPSRENADLAVAARIENIKKLYENGYRHFTLFTLPDFSLTPRFQKVSEQDRNAASQVSDYFNQQLKMQSEALKLSLPDLNIVLFDVNPTLREVIATPELYGFNSSKLYKPFVESKKYKEHKTGPLAASDYVFWDDIHPSSHTHALISKKFYTYINSHYRLEPPVNDNIVANTSAAALYAQFMKAYTDKYNSDRHGFFGRYRKSNLLPKLKKYQKSNAFDEYNDYPLYLVEIFKHAFQGGGKRTKSVLQSINWLDKNSNINTNIDVLDQIKEIIEENNVANKSMTIMDDVQLNKP